MSAYSYEEQKTTWQRVIGPVFACLITIYFVYHIFQGERGVISWFVLSKKVQEETSQLKLLEEEKEFLKRRVSLLNPNNLDLDILEELARKLLNYAKTNEIIVYEEFSKMPHVDKSKGIDS